MSEDEIIKYANNIINATFIEATLQDKDGNIIEQGFVNKDVIKGLLDLYQKEKDLNQELQIRYKIENDKYKEEKEKNKELDEKFKYAVPDEIVEQLYISKDKIREKIKELEDIKSAESIEGTLEEIKLLKELLEENNEM